MGRMGTWLFAAGALSAACGDVDVEPADRACDPGLVVECPCGGGAVGTQTCEEDGSGFGACSCSTGAITSGLVSSTGAGASTVAGTGGDPTGSGGAGAGSGTGGDPTGSGGAGAGSGTGGDPSGSGGGTTGSGGAGGCDDCQRAPFGIVLSSDQQLFLHDMKVGDDGSVFFFATSFGGVEFGGELLGGAFLLKVGPDGAPAWAVPLPNLGGAGGIALTPDGDVIVASPFTGLLNLGGEVVVSDGGSELAIARYSADGEHLASRGFLQTSGASLLPTAVTVAGDGTIVVVGELPTSIDLGDFVLTTPNSASFLVAFDGTLEPLWGTVPTNMKIRSLSTAPDGEIVAAGFGAGAMALLGATANEPSEDFVIARISSSQEVRWLRTFGSDATSEGAFLQVTHRADGAILLTGQIRNGARVDFGGGELISSTEGAAIAAALESDGQTHLWSHLFGGISNAATLDASSGDDLRVVVVGEFAGNMTVGGDALSAVGPTDAFLGVVDAAGSVEEGRRFGSAGLDLLFRVVVEPGGTMVLAGYAEGPVDLGGGPLVPEGVRALLLARVPAP